jgi:hypothetical protein
MHLEIAHDFETFRLPRFPDVAPPIKPPSICSPPQGTEVVHSALPSSSGTKTSRLSCMLLDPSIALPSHVSHEAAALAGTLDHGSDHDANIEVGEEDSWDSAVDNGVPGDKEERIAWADRKKRRKKRIAKEFFDMCEICILTAV